MRRLRNQPSTSSPVTGRAPFIRLPSTLGILRKPLASKQVENGRCKTDRREFGIWQKEIRTSARGSQQNAGSMNLPQGF